MTDDAAKGKQSQIWGMMMQKHAFLYLKKNLQDQGWMLKEGQTIDNKEYDCIGWEGKKSEVNHPDLAIEMYFPPVELPRRVKIYLLEIFHHL